MDGQGNSYVTGFFNDMATFGPGEPNETTLTSAGSGDIFVAKYASDGVLLWVKQAGGTDPDFFDLGFGITTDGQGNSYVTGRFADTATFGPGEPNETTLTDAGTGDIFVAKYASDGNLVWVKRAIAPEQDQGRGITITWSR